MGCFVVAEFLLTSASCGPSAIAEPLVVLMTNCCAGGLLLRLLITTSEAESALIAGLQLLQTLLPSDAFFGRGNSGPFLARDVIYTSRAYAMMPVRLSVCIIANLGFKFPSHFTAHWPTCCCGRRAAGESSRAMLASARISRSL